MSSQKRVMFTHRGRVFEFYQTAAPENRLVPSFVGTMEGLPLSFALIDDTVRRIAAIALGAKAQANDPQDWRIFEYPPRYIVSPTEQQEWIVGTSGTLTFSTLQESFGFINDIRGKWYLHDLHADTPATTIVGQTIDTSPRLFQPIPSALSPFAQHIIGAIDII